ncbi:hypothetical protein KORDIASMS9_02805 [Kordia sp. SMS9]|uniref:hypothetical protein n=1 Tax=Kordia sp. SMS9 TaxID=2282170 RepID=UPI000E0DF5FE|nr:hypothetical protein [Kordia sp. SMS9]AXG70565.1 hypothetical protein KORDIASMS9_02805 [Kordia sp. SMS9]
MVIDIIDDQYFKKTKFRKILSKIVDASLIVFLLLIGIHFLFSLPDYNDYAFIGIGIWIVCSVIISLLDVGLFIRSGTVKFENDLMIITNENSIHEINLRTVEEMQLRKVGRELFTLKIGRHEILIELTLDKKLKFKNKLQAYNIKIDSFFYGIKF